MLHPGRVVETSESQPCVVGVVVVVIVVSVLSRVLHSDTPSAEHTWRGVRMTRSVMTTLTTQLGSLCDWHFHNLVNVLGLCILHGFLHPF